VLKYNKFLYSGSMVAREKSFSEFVRMLTYQLINSCWLRTK